MTVFPQQPAPDTRGRFGDAGFARRFGFRKSLINDLLNQFDSTGERESCILVNVHSAELLRGLGWVAPPSFSDSVRMDSNNLLELHS